LLGYLQNHDQIGNRARGERISQLTSEGLLRIGAALVFVSPFVPMLFQGEEWGASAPFQYFTDHQNPELAEAVRKGRREEFKQFGWDPEQVPDPQAEATLRRSQLDWSERERAPHRERLTFYKSLIALRRKTPELLDGRRDAIDVRFDEDKRWLRVERGPVCLLANFGSNTLELPAPAGRLELSYPEASPQRSGSKITLPPESCYIYRA
jgi:maltooligosyltrehalose trehalohydrolase